MSDIISVKSGVKVVEVNDLGETISLPLGDQAFTHGLVELMQMFSDKAGEVAQACKNIEISGNAAAKAEQLSSAASLNLKVCTEMKDRVDALFCDEVCRKVFGDIVPSMTAFSDFFDQLAPFMEEYGRERAEESRRRVERYTKKYQKNDDKTVPGDRG